VVNRIVQFPFILAAGNGGNMTNVRSLTDFLNIARTKPKLVSYASSGPGSVSHLSSELLAAATKVEFLHVPYKGTGAAITDIIGGRVDFTLSSAPEIIGFLKNKQLRGLAVMSSQRLNVLPDLPPVTDTIKGLELGNWFAFLVPSGVPRPILEKLNADIGRAATSDRLKAKWEEQTTTGSSYALKDVDAHYRSELQRWDKIVKSLGLENLNK
jgi:tripartite-type tricarboxylate transporter receptor subunit TctC